MKLLNLNIGLILIVLSTLIILINLVLMIIDKNFISIFFGLISGISFLTLGILMYRKKSSNL
jgi:glucose dehydrogenase